MAPEMVTFFLVAGAAALGSILVQVLFYEQLYAFGWWLGGLWGDGG